MKQILLLISLALTTGFVSGQSDFCGMPSVEESIMQQAGLTLEQKLRMIREHDQQMAADKKKIEQFRANIKEDKVYVIPVVFHIVHNFGPENISDAQILDQLRVMNEEYNKKNARLSGVREEFIDIIADCRIEFRLATKTPDGKCTNGIHRYVNPNTYFTSMQQIQKLKPQIFWPIDKYLNCLIVGSIESNGQSRTLGFAQFPFFGSDLTDGLVMVHDGTGSIGTSTPSRASVTTHEVGHWLGLYHTWGKKTECGKDTACYDDDDVEDTPNTKGSPSVCDLNEKSCGPLANVQNFMDYSFCYAMFTEGQKTRMHYYLNNVEKRRRMWQPENLVATGTDYETGNQPTLGFCVADFNHSAYEPQCLGTTVQFQDASYTGVKYWKWSFPGGNPSISNERNPVVTYVQPGTYSVTLQVSDSVETKVVTKTNTVTILSVGELGTTYSQDFETLDLEEDHDFKTINIDGDTQWEIAENAGYNSSRSLFFRNYKAPSNRIDAVVSSTLDLSKVQNPLFTFRYAFTTRDATSSDELKVYVSTDCGKTWSPRATIKGTLLKTADTDTAEFVPASEEDWALYTVKIDNYKVENLRIKFEWKSAGGNNIYIDNINISDLTSIDENLLQTSFLVHPNPAADQATLAFNLTESSAINLEVLDLAGKVVRTISPGVLSSGQHEITINREDLTAGMYILRIKENNKTIVKKLSFN